MLEIRAMTQLQPALTLRSCPLLDSWRRFNGVEVLAASTSCILATRFCATLIVRVTGTRTSCAARLVDGSEAGAVCLMLITNCCGKRRLVCLLTHLFSLLWSWWLWNFWEMTHCRRPLSTLISQSSVWCLLFLCLHVSVCLLHVRSAGWMQLSRNKSHQCCFVDSSSSSACSEI